MCLTLTGGYAWGAKDFTSNYGRWSDPSKRQLERQLERLKEEKVQRHASCNDSTRSMV